MKLFNMLCGVVKKGALAASGHVPSLLTAGGVAGYFAMIPITIKCHNRANQMFADLINEKASNGEELDFSAGEKFKVMAKAYWPVATDFVISTACVIGAQRANSRHISALEAGLLSAQGEISTLKETITEQVGEKNAKGVIDKKNQKLSERAIKEAEANGEKPEETGYGTQLCVDLFTGRTFYSDIESIRRAYNDLNEERINDLSSFTSLNSLYYYLGLEGSEVGRIAIWQNDGSYKSILPEFVSGLTEDGKTYLGFRSSPEPTFI